MCGIAGLVLQSFGRADGKLIASLSDDLWHRGPDDSGVLAVRGKQVSLYRELPEEFLANAVLLHRRLSIIDLSDGGWQPMGSPDGRFYVVFNGEIYNYLELRAELSARGHRFRSGSDTEVLLAAYSEWGREALIRLRGMFAFTILDVDLQKLFIARDFFGIKPLYYANWRDGFVFASEIPPILRLPGVNRNVNPQRLYDYLRFGLTDYGNETLFENVKQLPPAHYLEVSLETLGLSGPECYWQVDLNQRIDLPFDAAVSRLRDLFLESVSLHLRSDVPVGAALSGGIDSSAIVASMRHINAALPIHAFSFIADDPVMNEERWVDAIGASANLVVHKVKPRPGQLADELEDLIAVQGECFSSASVYAQRRVFQEARDAGIKVMLDGQGADEILGGYETYLAARLVSLLRAGKFAESARFVRNASKLRGLAGWRLWLRAPDFFMPPTLQRPVRRWMNQELIPAWLNAQWFSDRKVKVRSLNYKSGNNVLKQTLHQTLTETNLPALLRYEDRNSMAFSIESRVPFLTPALVNFVLALPEDYIISTDGTTKAIFRQAMRGIVPDVILDRNDKIGFAAPDKQWLLTLRAPVERLLASETAMQISAINLKEIQRQWNDVVAGRNPFNLRVWRWINLILWVQKFAVNVA
jgi:asparagine synthase (glutamine-hydrolysing)